MPTKEEYQAKYQVKLVEFRQKVFEILGLDVDATDDFALTELQIIFTFSEEIRKARRTAIEKLSNIGINNIRANL